jgi:UDP-glucose 4-epimerase
MILNKKILIIGGAGFVGSNLCKALSKNNYVQSLDNYFTGSLKNHYENVDYIKGDSKNIFELINTIPDLIFHLGEYSRVEQSFNDLDKVWEFNTQGTFEVCKFAKQTNAKLIYSGSSTKFQEGSIGKYSSPYAFSKAQNTEFIKAFDSWYELNYAITYFYNVYGSNEIQEGKYATLIGLFTNLKSKKKPLTVVKPGNQRRNFTHVDDIVNGLILVGEFGSGDGYGIGADESYTVSEVAEFFGGEINFLEERKGNRISAKLNVEKTKQIGWKSKKRLIDYIKLLKDNNWNN